MSALLPVRRIPMAGEPGCIGSCPLCTKAGTAKAFPPCLACREELRNRLATMQTSYYVARAMN